MRPSHAATKVGGAGSRILLGQADAPVPVALVRGTPYEMGWHLGYLLHDDLQQFVPAILAKVKRTLKLSDQELANVWSQTTAFRDVRIDQELRGLADGSGVPLVTLQAANALPLLMPHSCSSIAAWGNATDDAHLYQTRDWDWNLALRAHDHAVVVVYLPTRGFAHVVPRFAGMIGAHTGMNARGIVLAEMGDTPASEAPYNIAAAHFTFFFRTLLYDARSLSQALEIFQTLPHTKRYHYVLGDGRAEHRAVKIRAHMPEPPDRRLRIWTDNDPTDELAPQVLEQVVYNDEGRGAFPLLKSAYGTLNADHLIQIANHIAIRGENVMNVVYDATAMRLWLSYAKKRQEAYLRPYTLIDLMTLDADQDGKPDCAQAFSAQ